MGGQGGCEQRTEVFVKIQKKKIFFFGGGGLGWGGGGGQGGCESRIEVFWKIQTSSPKGNDAHLRAIIQSKKKWKHQFFRRLRAALWSVVRDRIWPIFKSSKLLCMLSLPVSMKRITSRTT